MADDTRARSKPEPAHEQAQRVVIGSLLLRPMDFHTAKIETGFFTLPDCRRTIEAIIDLWDEGITPDILSILDWTEANKGRALTFDELNHLSGFTSLSWEFSRSVAIVRQAYIDRQIRLVAEGIRTSPKRGSALLADATTAFNRIGDSSKNGAVLLTQAVGELLSDAERRQQGDTGSQIITGVTALDKELFLDRGAVVTIAGCTSMGKSTVANHLIDLWAKAGERILLFSTETSTSMVARRFLASTAELNSREFGYGEDSADTWRKMTSGASKLHGHSVWIDDESDNARDIAKVIRRARQQDGITIVVVDHIQECIPNEDPRTEMNQLISSLRSACREEPKITLVLISQLSRAVERRESRLPRLSDLKESGNIENASDQVIFVFRPWYYADHLPKYKKVGPGELWINRAKVRDGPTGWFGFGWTQQAHIRGVLDRISKDDL